MRPFETLTLLFAALSLLPFLLRRRRLRWLSFGALAAMLIHLALEGYRWQMAPAYLLVAALTLLSLLSLSRPTLLPRRRFLRPVAALLAILWLLFAAALPALLPVPQPLAPTGPYAVGTRSFYLVDLARPEIYNAQVENRELMIQVWYPGQVAADSPRAPFIDRIDVAGPAIARRLNLPTLLTGHLNLVQTHAYLDVPAIVDGLAFGEEGPFPLLIFSHGLRGIRAQNSSLMQQLASHGYVVVAIDHPYANVLTVFPDDRIVFYDEEAVMPPGMSVGQAGAQLVAVWEQDIAFVVQQMSRWTEEPGHPFYRLVDPSRLGTLGHSTGGGAAIQACARLPQCAAALALDGWIEPVAADLLREPYRPALMLISAPDWLGPNNRALGERLYRERAAEGYLLTVAGTVHFDYTDIPLMSPLTSLIGLSGDIPGPRMVTLLNDYALAFFDQTLKQRPAPLLTPAATATTYPEVTFATP